LQFKPITLILTTGKDRKNSLSKILTIQKYHTMKNKIALLLFLVLPTLCWSQESKVYDNLTIKSSILKTDKKFAICLPAGYETSQRSYPVVYLLHGYGDNQTGWVQFGEVQSIVDKGISEGKITPMIIVMPDGEKTWYMNDAMGKYPFEDFFIKELIPYIEKNYHCRTEKEFRAIAGLSMGGFGSLLNALHHPDLFNTCVALSAAVFPDEDINKMSQADFSRTFGKLVGDLKEGEPRINDFWNKNSILYLVKNMPESQKNAVRFWIDCGDDDFLYKGNSMLHILMRDLNIPHEFRIRDGKHTWEYWRTGLPDALNYITQGFHR
jgi:S-formylglutathione hydrolase FrmB